MDAKVKKRILYSLLVYVAISYPAVVLIAYSDMGGFKHVEPDDGFEYKNEIAYRARSIAFSPLSFPFIGLYALAQITNKEC